MIIFKRSDENNYSFVYKQPADEAERLACEEALTCCPVEAIGNDGE
jgi:ferredoxin